MVAWSAIDHEMKRLGVDCVYLDISHQPADFIRNHFPTVYTECLKFGIDITREAIPVVPAAHYTCGGIMTNMQGQTDIDNLYAIGETAFTGLHGANRMASNSLLECLVFAKAAAEDIATRLNEPCELPDLPQWDASRVTKAAEEIVISHDWDELRRVMWDYVGIVRTDKRLQRALARIQLMQKEIDEYYASHTVNNDSLELRNLVLVAELIVRSAIARKESRGLHYTMDYPEPSPDLNKDTILTPPTI